MAMNINKLIVSYLFSLCFTATLASVNDSLLWHLYKHIDNKELYIQRKEEKIGKLKGLLSVEGLSDLHVYDINKRLFEEYKKYRTDSALLYVNKNMEIAKRADNKRLEYENMFHLTYMYCSLGMYIEARNILDGIDKDKLPPELLPDYFETYGSFCSRYGQSNGNTAYYIESERYRDSLLSVLDTTSFRYKVAYAAKLLYGNQPVEDRLLSLLDGSDEERGTIAYFLGYYYQKMGDNELAEKYFIISTITDIEKCIKDNASIRALALIYYEKGDIDKAYKLMQSAIDDAVSGNVRYRTVEISESYPIINAAYQSKENKSKTNLQILLTVISIMSLFLIAGLLYIYRQMKRLSGIRKELYHTNKALSRLNDELTTTNSVLKESNYIKEEYIAHFFDLCSAYIDKFEKYRKTLNKYVSNNQINEVVKTLRSTSFVESELEELYKRFDIIFLNLYPTFVEDFNALRVKEERTIIKRGELMNTELRIFALIRLGINDSVKIAGFLHYSISTIYNYRVKARNSALVPRDKFEEEVMKIGSIIDKNT
jgi:DNA-binding CsgD family transcriptional regulator